MNYLKFFRFLSLPLCLLMILVFAHEAMGQDSRGSRRRQRTQSIATIDFGDPNQLSVNATRRQECNMITGQFCLILGTNEAQADGGLLNKPPRQLFSYSANLTENQAVTAESVNAPVVVIATSKIIVAEENTNISLGGNSSSFPWTVQTLTNITRNGANRSGRAVSQARDPVPFAIDDIPSNPIFEEVVTLFSGLDEDTMEPNWSVFKESEFDNASARIFRDSTLLTDIPETPEREDRIFDIIISATTSFVAAEESPDEVDIPSTIDAEVFINPNLSLTFFEAPDLTIPITAADLEVFLEEELENPENGLGTPDGLTSDISFSYTWDLSSFDIGPNDTIGGGSTSFVQAVSTPESSTNVSILLFGGLGTLLMGKRQLNSNKSLKK